MNLRTQNFYEPETTKKYKHKTQKKRTSGPKNSVRKRQVFEHNTKSLMNLRPQNYMNLRPQTKIVNPRLQKSCEPKANHAACSANASGGEALRPPPQPPLQLFLLGLPPLQGQPTPTWNVSTSNWNHRKKMNSQNISAPVKYWALQRSYLQAFFWCVFFFESLVDFIGNEGSVSLQGASYERFTIPIMSQIYPPPNKSSI